MENSIKDRKFLMCSKDTNEERGMIVGMIMIDDET